MEMGKNVQINSRNVITKFYRTATNEFRRSALLENFNLEFRRVSSFPRDQTHIKIINRDVVFYGKKISKIVEKAFSQTI